MSTAKFHAPRRGSRARQGCSPSCSLPAALSLVTCFVNLCRRRASCGVAASFMVHCLRAEGELQRRQGRAGKARLLHDAAAATRATTRVLGAEGSRQLILEPCTEEYS